MNFSENRYASNHSSKIETYKKIMRIMFLRLLNYAKIPYKENAGFNELYELVNDVYYVPEQKSLNYCTLEEQDVSRFCKIIEDEYKNIAISYKQRYKRVLTEAYDNELNATDSHYNFPMNRAQRISFESLLIKNGKDIYRELKKSAESENSVAQILLGKLNFLGWGTKVDEKLGLSWFTKAAQNNNAEAYFYIGLGLEITNNAAMGTRLNDESPQYYLKAYNLGYTEASYALYRYYSRYISGKTGAFKAKRWLKRGVENKSAHCLYETNRGEEVQEQWHTNNQETIIEWLRFAEKMKIEGTKELLKAMTASV